MREICVIGTGYVGLVTGACLAELGHRVVCVDSDKKKVAALKAGKVPIHEPGLGALAARNRKAGRLTFTTSIAEGMNKRPRPAEVVFIAVGTPPRHDGSADLSGVEAVAQEVARTLAAYTVIVDKSTVPVETGEWVSKTVKRFNRKGVPYDVASNPEFLSEGSAVEDFLKPDRIVLGVASKRAEEVLRSVYAPIQAPVLVTDVKSAELIKHASNSFLAAKISFINAISVLCEKTGADVSLVAKGMGLDRRIGPSFLRAGIGFGGFCLAPEEQVLLRDPQGTLRILSAQEAWRQVRDGQGVWEALSLDPASNGTRFTPLTGVGRRSYRGVLVRIRTKMGRTATVTADHPILVRRDDRWDTIPASQLTEEDWMPCFLSAPGSPSPIVIDLIDALQAKRPDFFDRILVRPQGSKNWNLDAGARKALLAITGGDSCRTHDIARRGSPMRIAEFLELESLGVLATSREGVELATTKGNATYVPARVALTEDLCRILGYIATEGCIVQERNPRGLRERTSVHFHEEEREYLADLAATLNNLGIRHSLVHVPQHKTRRTVISSRIFAFLLRDVLGCGHDSYTARVPEAVLTSAPALRQAFLIGSLRGDGSMYFPRGAKSATCEFGTASPEMALGLTSLSHSIGLVPSYKTAWMNKSTVPAHFLRFSGADQLMRLLDAKDSATTRRLRGVLKSASRRQAPSGYRRLTEDAAMVRVVGIERLDYRGPVYSLEVDKDHTFALGSGLIVHNCFPKDLEAFHWIAKQKGYDFKLLQDVKEINEEQKLWVVRRLEEELWNLEGKSVAVLGLAFKPNTDDLRFAPSLEIIAALRERKVKVAVYDPVAMPKARALLKGVRFAKDAYDAAKGADCVALVTEWPEFAHLDLGRLKKTMRTAILLDGRNVFDPAKARAHGFSYRSVGRP